MSWRDRAVLLDDGKRDTESWRDKAIPVSREQIPQVEEALIEQDRMLKGARSALGQAPFPTVRGGTLAGGAFLLSGVARGAGILKRAVGGKSKGEEADYWSRYGSALLRVAGERAEEPGNIIPPIVKRGLAGALATAPTMAITAPLGPYGMIIGGALSEANNARTEGKDAGLKDKELNLYVARQGMIEGILAGAMQKFGVGGLEKVAGSRAAISNGIRQTLKQGKTVKGAIKGAVRDFTEEEVEEVATAVLQTLNDKYSGVSKEDITLKSLASVAAETTSQVVWTMGGVSAFNVPAQISEGKKAKAEQEIVAFAESGKAPSRKQWSKKWGLPVDKIKSAEDRLQAVQELAGEIQAQREAPSEQAAIEAPVALGAKKEYYNAPRVVGDVKEGKSLGLWLSDDRSVAAEYGGGDETVRIYKPNIKRELVIRKFSSEFPEMFTNEEVNERLKESGVQYQFKDDEDQEFSRYVDDGGSKLIKAIKKAGYDALSFPDRQGYKAFNSTLFLGKEKPAQIKVPVTPVEPVWKTEGPAVTEKGEVSQFIEGPEGEIGVSLKALSKGIGFIKHVGQRFFTARGELPDSIYRENVRKDGTISRIQREISLKIKDYERAVKSEFGKRDLTNKETVAFNAALKGEVPLESLPENVAVEVGIQRNYIDALSGRAIEIGAISGPLVGVVNKNKGIYIHRSYRKHDSPKWAEEVPVEIRNIAEAHLRQEYPNKTEPEIQGLIEKLLYEGSASESPIASLKKSGLGAKDIRILMKRGDFSPEIRDLMGEYKETRVNFAKSATYLGNLIANHQFLESVRELGMGTFFSDVPVVNDYGELKTRIAADESNVMNPLNGLYTTTEIKEAFERASGKGSNKPAWLRWAMTTNAIVKMNKTVGSAGTQFRNFIAGVGFALMQGHWRVGKLYHSYKAIATNITKKNDAEWRAYTLRLIELRVIGQGVRAGELRAHIRDNANMSEVEFNDSVTSRRAKKTKKLTEKVVRGGLDVVQGAYLAEDDFWKIYGYENELADHRKALPELPITEVEEIAAEKLTNTYPTWFRVPEGVRIMRHLPVGPFVSFPAEIVRTAYHTANYAQQELRDPRLRKIGARRLVGMAMAMTASKGLAEAFKMVAKISADDDEDLRWFVPPWQKNSVLLHLGKVPLVAGKAVYRYVDASYSDPHNTLITPFNAMASGKDPKEGIWNAIKDFAEPYVGEEILYGKIVDVWSNNDNGVPVYNPQDSVNRQALDVSAHLWEAFEYGTITSGRRVYKGVVGTTSVSGRAFNPWVESIAVITGQRIQDLDVAESLKWRARDYNRGIRQANRLLNSVITRGGSVSETEIRDAYERSDTARRGLFSDMSGAAQAAIRLDVSPDEVETTLMANGVSKIDIPNVMGGVYSKRRITNAQLRAMEQANLSEFPMRLEVLEDLLRKDVDF